MEILAALRPSAFRERRHAKIQQTATSIIELMKMDRDLIDPNREIKSVTSIQGFAIGAETCIQVDYRKGSPGSSDSPLAEEEYLDMVAGLQNPYTQEITKDLGDFSTDPQSAENNTMSSFRALGCLRAVEEALTRRVNSSPAPVRS